MAIIFNCILKLMHQHFKYPVKAVILLCWISKFDSNKVKIIYMKSYWFLVASSSDFSQKHVFCKKITFIHNNSEEGWDIVMRSLYKTLIPPFMNIMVGLGDYQAVLRDYMHLTVHDLPLAVVPLLDYICLFHQTVAAEKFKLWPFIYCCYFGWSLPEGNATCKSNSFW